LERSSSSLRELECRRALKGADRKQTATMIRTTRSSPRDHATGKIGEDAVRNPNAFIALTTELVLAMT